MNMYIFGDAFLRGYYSVYDFQSNKVGIALHKYSMGTLEKKFPKWAKILISLVSVGLMVLLGFFIYQR
jgi:hypothetical protein